MALTVLNFSFKGNAGYHLPKEWSHTGIVGSGVLEILMEEKALGGGVEITVTTPVTGFDDVWQRVLEKFVEEFQVGNIKIDINDNNATPFIVSLRLRQAMIEAGEEGNF